jgi:hypothetical protein
MKEEWRTVVIHGKEHPWYSVSNFGNVRSTPRENSRAAVKHYGGNIANKNKEGNDDCIKIIEPAFNPLLQEYEDGEIQFVGQEGEKYYNMLEEIAKERGKSMSGKFYFEIIKEQLDEMVECEFK